MTAPRQTKPMSERLLQHRRVVEETGCWEWTSSVKSNGYAQIRVEHGGKRRWFHVHRVAYELWVGPIPEGMLICHMCDNRRCFNPDHLYHGTHQQNMADMYARGRQRKNYELRTHCKKNGHEFTPENTVVRQRFGRQLRDCRQCIYERNRAWSANNRRKSTPAPAPRPSWRTLFQRSQQTIYAPGNTGLTLDTATTPIQTLHDYAVENPAPTTLAIPPVPGRQGETDYQPWLPSARAIAAATGCRRAALSRREARVPSGSTLANKPEFERLTGFVVQVLIKFDSDCDLARIEEV